MRKVMVLLLGVAVSLTALPAAAAPTSFTAGASQSGDPYFPERGNGGYDAFSYATTVEVAIGAPGTPRSITKGTTIMTATALQNLSAFSMDLVGMKVAKVTVGGKTAKFTRTERKINIRPASGIKKGATFLVHIDYSGTPTKVPGPDGRYFEGWLETSDGVSAVGDPNSVALWMPVNDARADKALVSVTARVPKGYYAFSNGKLVREPKMVKGLMEFPWKANQPMSPHYVLLSIGYYDTIDTYVIPKVIPLSGIDPALDPAQQEMARKLIGQMKEILTFFQGKLGTYPFDSIGAVFDKLDSSFSVDSQTRAFYPDGAINENVAEEFFVHQMVHAWFGQSVTPQRSRDIFLTESFANYFTWLWFEQKTANYTDTLFDNLYNNGVDSLWEVNIADPGPANLFNIAIYYRGAMVLHVMRKTMGDVQFYSMMKAWLAKKQYQTATVEEFVDFAQSKSTKDLSLLFRDWLYTPSKPTRTSY